MIDQQHGIGCLPAVRRAGELVDAGERVWRFLHQLVGAYQPRRLAWIPFRCDDEPPFALRLPGGLGLATATTAEVAAVVTATQPSMAISTPLTCRVRSGVIAGLVTSRPMARKIMINAPNTPTAATTSARQRNGSAGFVISAAAAGMISTPPKVCHPRWFATAGRSPMTEVDVRSSWNSGLVDC